MKKCSACGKRKPLEEFHVDRRAKDGRQAACKPCQLQRSRESYLRHREKKLAWQKQYYRDNPERVKAIKKRWADKHPENLPERKKRYRARHKEELSQKFKEWYEANREDVLARKAEWREENREAIYARRDWNKHYEAGRRRRARKLNAYVAPVDLDETIKRDQGCCGICGKPIVDDTLELDHVIPLSRGGTHEPDNVQIAHRLCNRRKHARANFTLDEAA